MEQQIKDLIDSIRKDGIDAANAESEKIIQEAQAKASSIIAAAEAEKARLLKEAEKEIQLSRTSSEDSIKQAARNVSLQLKKSIEDEYSAILKQAVKGGLKGKPLMDLVKIVLEGDVSGKAVELSKADLEALSVDLSVVFAEEIKKGLEFRPSPVLQAGFRVVEKDGSGYVDVSDEKCAELLLPYLSETLKAIL